MHPCVGDFVILTFPQEDRFRERPCLLADGSLVGTRLQIHRAARGGIPRRDAG